MGGFTYVLTVRGGYSPSRREPNISYTMSIGVSCGGNFKEVKTEEKTLPEEVKDEWTWLVCCLRGP